MSSESRSFNSTKIRIVYFITSLESGGSERQLANMLSLLPAEQYEKHIVCLSGFGILEDRFREITDSIHDLRYPRLRKNGKIQYSKLPSVIPPIFRLVKLLKNLKPDILHTFIPVCNVMGAVAGKIARVPAIISSRLSLGNYRDTNKIFAMLEDLTDPAFTLIHCKSEGIKADIVAREPVDIDRLRVIYNGINLHDFEKPVDKQTIRDEFGLEMQSPVIGIVANLKPYKGHTDLVAAMPAILKIHPETKFLFIGRDDGIADDLRRQAEQLGVSGSLILAGERDNVPALMQILTLLVSASHEEGFSNVILEGMATGLPVVATNVGGNPEAVKDHYTGLLVPAKSPESLAKAINDLLSNPNEMRHMGIRGRLRVEDLFSNQAMIRKTKELYTEAIELS